jgi:hypothetical protein
VEIVEHRDAVAAKPPRSGVEQEASPRSQCFFVDRVGVVTVLLQSKNLPPEIIFERTREVTLS